MKHFILTVSLLGSLNQFAQNSFSNLSNINVINNINDNNVNVNINRNQINQVLFANVQAKVPNSVKHTSVRSTNNIKPKSTNKNNNYQQIQTSRTSQVKRRTISPTNIKQPQQINTNKNVNPIQINSDNNVNINENNNPTQQQYTPNDNIENEIKQTISNGNGNLSIIPTINSPELSIPKLNLNFSLKSSVSISKKSSYKKTKAITNKWKKLKRNTLGRLASHKKTKFKVDLCFNWI